MWCRLSQLAIAIALGMLEALGARLCGVACYYVKTDCGPGLATLSMLGLTPMVSMVFLGASMHGRLIR